VSRGALDGATANSLAADRHRPLPEARSGEVVNEKNAPNTDALRFGLSSLNDRTH
jgi:hypothetical protein